MITRTASGSCVRSSVIRVIPHEHRRQQITGPPPSYTWLLFNGQKVYFNGEPVYVKEST